MLSQESVDVFVLLQRAPGDKFCQCLGAGLITQSITQKSARYVFEFPCTTRSPCLLANRWFLASFGRHRCGSVHFDRIPHDARAPPGADAWAVDAQCLVDAFGEGGCGVFSLFQGAAGDKFGECF